MKNRRMILNISSQILGFIINTGINFLLTPFIIKYIGTEVYGFVGLSNNFISYLSIFTVALNSMLNRYVMLSLKSNDLEKAKKYFSSTGIVNIFISLVLFIPLLLVIFSLEQIVVLPTEFINDIKILGLFTVLNFLLTLSTSVFNVSFFCENRLDLASIRNIKSDLIRVVLLVLLFGCFSPRIYYIGVTALIVNIYVAITNIRLTHILTPKLKINKKYLDNKCLKELFSVGIWNSVNQLSHIFMTGLDLLITNLFMGSYIMGLFSMAKIVPIQLQSLMQLVSSSFTPHLTEIYSKEGNDELIIEIKNAMNVTAFLSLVPLMGFIIFGDDFFNLWLINLSQEDKEIVYYLAVLTLLPTIIDAMVNPLYHVFTITAKVRIPVIINLIIGLINISLVYLMLKNTSLGVLVVAGVSSFMVFLKVTIFIPIYAANNLKIKWYSFYSPLFKGSLSCIILGFLFLVFKHFNSILSWGDLIYSAVVCGIIGYIINTIFYFSPKIFSKPIYHMVKRA